MKPLYLHFILALLALALPQPRLEAAAAWAVADATSGHLLESRHGDKRLPVASLTKVATAMVTIDWAEKTGYDLNSRVVIPVSALAVGGANPVGFQPGDQVTVRDLLYAALLQSDNVAAQALAYHIGRAVRSPRAPENASPAHLFVGQMNALARKLGMAQTRFLNPSGLDHEEVPYSTANDMTRLNAYAMQNSAFRFIVSQKSRKITRQLATGETAEYQLVNTNELLGVHKIDGVKTGRTNRAGGCLAISSAKRPESVANPDGTHTVTPRRLIVVVLGSSDRFTEADRLLQRGWYLYDQWAAQGRPMKKK